MEAIQLVLPDGRALSGAAAVPEILRRLRRWRWLAAAFSVPGAQVARSARLRVDRAAPLSHLGDPAPPRRRA